MSVTEQKKQHSLIGWKTYTIGSLCEISRGGSPRPIQDFLTTSPDGYNWLRIGDVPTKGKFISKITAKIIKEGLKKTTLVKPGDFILSNSMSFGRPYIMKVDACIHDGWLALKNLDASLIERDYLFYLLLSPKLQNDFRNYSAGSGVLNLKKETVEKVLVTLPEVDEQKRIVKVLETWDKAIEKLEQSILLKRRAKKGLMQKLFTSELRLPGFSGEWIEVKLSECLTIKHGKPQKEVESKNGKYPIYGTGGEFGRADSYLYDKPSVLVGRKGTIDKPIYLDKPFWTVDTLFYSHIKDGHYPKFYYYLFLRINWKKYNEGSGVPSLSASTVSSIKVLIPSDREEQEAISNVLSAIDKNIELLESKKNLIKEQKKHLLNNLVTGQIRTPENL